MAANTWMSKEPEDWVLTTPVFVTVAPAVLVSGLM